MPPFIFEPIARIKTQAAGAVPLSGQNVDRAIAIPIHRIGPGNHLGRLALKDHYTFRIGELRLGPGRAGTNVPVKTNAVFKIASN